MRRIGAVAVLAALALLAAGCGGSSDSSSAGDTTAVTDTVSTDTTATDTSSSDTTAADTTATDTTSSDTTATDTTSGDTTATDTTSSDTGSTDTTSLGGVKLTGACKDLAEVGQKYSDAITKATSGSGTQDLNAVAAAFSEFADKVPSEVKGDFQVIADAFKSYAEAMKGVDLKAGQAPSADDLAKLTKAAKAFDNAKLQQASSNISAWVAKNCGTTSP